MDFEQFRRLGQAIESSWRDVDYDDGWAAWINGVEVFRSPEMPAAGALDWNAAPTQHESSNFAEPVYEPYHDITALAQPALVQGVNTLAVGIWNTSAASSDLLLVPRLLANPDTQVLRGPYLQMATPSGSSSPRSSMIAPSRPPRSCAGFRRRMSRSSPSTMRLCGWSEPSERVRTKESPR